MVGVVLDADYTTNKLLQLYCIEWYNVVRACPSGRTMSTQASPFEILGITPTAEPEVVTAAYKALARKYHPDLNPGLSHAEFTRRMVELNWAKEELARDLDGWRRRVSKQPTEEVPREDALTRAASPLYDRSAVEVKPQVLIIPGKRGSTAVFEASVQGASSSSIRARFKSTCIDVQRLPPGSDCARFRVAVIDDFTSDLRDNAIETIEVVAPGCVNKVFVSIAPVSKSVLSQEYGGRIAPPRHASYNAHISFGKHRSRTFQEIALEEPEYLNWMLREGAGSRIERDSARLALNLLGRGALMETRAEPPPLIGGQRRGPRERSLPATAIEPARTSKALPDPRRPGGFWDKVASLFRPK